MSSSAEWYTQPMRWGQVNLKEDDPLTLDVNFWVDYWKRSRLDGVTLNAGVSVAYYPTQIPLHRRARFLADRDTFGDLVRAAKQLNLRVLARLDPNFGHEEMLEAHPDWFLTDPNGQPRQREQTIPISRDSQFGSAKREILYSTCWNSPFHRQFVPEVMTEILTNYDVDGFFTNAWPPLSYQPPDLSMVCYCPHCQKRWHDRGHDQLPEQIRPADPVWQDFVLSVQESVEEVQTLWQQHTQQLKPSATFVLDSHAGLATGLRWERYIQLGDISVNDAQGRWSVGNPLWESGRSGKVTLATVEGKPSFRLFGTWHTIAPLRRQTARPVEEETLFMAEAVANGQRLWWHSLGGISYDRRWMDGVADYFNWHAKVEKYFRNTNSLAEIGLIWSPHAYWLEKWADGPSVDGPLASEALSGWYLALLESRLPFDLVPEQKLAAGDLSRFRVLILPSATCLDEAAVTGLTRYVAAGGGLIVSHEASLQDGWGTPRTDLALGSLLGIRRLESPPPPLYHSYLRISENESGHPLLTNIHDTEIIPGARWLSRVSPLPGTTTITTLVPTYPTAPPEKVYMEPAQTDIPLIFLRENRGRSVYFAMDLDATYWTGRMLDHRRLLTNAIQWVSGSAEPRLTVTGPGLVDVTLWQQAESLTVHLVNLNTPNLYGGSVTELTPVGEQIVKLQLPSTRWPVALHLLRSGTVPEWQISDAGTLEVHVPQVLDHEVIGIDLG
jgi:hypothetical protein